ncbi:hypothetical protein [Enterobacter pseudoroggenkampii]|uniref:hypothetical protein n=1 Tax=Enterobacter pseudoroggenkampii TaxID=2996112 RepID=UPI002265341B|nr:hypothetical protein [Enterobacter pseudoroggenkampii]MCX8289122.1 hypothetical protein [Enterobacter pseudoroggenkampii]
MKQSYLYVLELEYGCFFIGYAIDVKSRIAKCFNGTANKVTKAYKPIRVVEICKGDQYDIIIKEKEYVEKYGRDRVLSHAYKQHSKYNFAKRKYI